ADLMKIVSDFSIPDGAVVADVTYGLGNFWKLTDTSRFNLLKSDKKAKKKEERHDFRNLPYATGSIDVVVLDPPFAHNGSTHITKKRYNNSTVSGKMGHDAILRLYRDGMVEAVRILKPDGGLLMVKCMDEIESDIQRRTHIELYLLALQLGLYDRDQFILHRKSPPPVCSRWKKQRHARKNHSFLLVLETREKSKRSRSRPACLHLPGIVIP